MALQEECDLILSHLFDRCVSFVYCFNSKSLLGFKFCQNIFKINMFRRDVRFSRLRDERVARLYSKLLLLKVLFVILNNFWISNDDFGFKCSLL